MRSTKARCDLFPSRHATPYARYVSPSLEEQRLCFEEVW
jgi:hypothetical protein